ncbi:N-acetylmannosamine-6-phosphate 2-epimerase [Microvirga puerhi]|uniref:N-acylglucosamine-6-phosphate 2-epimerase n=1 Tax=Microvirga puerhi TaxID=2876078 RepID=A0ABS7VU92_9HYPH|nr:N-acetylmannosamine-6-phosphate 2-epimerase [Microvirga puerhi]MBZ6079153.1 N-acetylmannosamine-6-phosphate 2-epimerase [Microvirga puerhi]
MGLLGPSARDDSLAALRGHLVVSCQAPVGSPMRGTSHMVAMAEAAIMGGAAGIRAQGCDDVQAIVRLGRPVIGLIKRDEPGSPVYITPRVDDVEALASSGAQIVAADATGRARASGETTRQLVAATHRAGALFMADVDHIDAALAAVEAGADLVGTTLSGYTGGPVPQEPDLGLVEELCRRLKVPVIAEGRYRTPEHVRAAFQVGAWSVVVGGAITDPLALTRRLVEARIQPFSAESVGEEA